MPKMQKAQNRKRLWLTLGIFSLVSIIAGTPLLALTALKGVYIPMGILIAVVGHGFWGAPFYFLGLYRTKKRMIIVLAVTEENILGVTALSDITWLKEKELVKYLKKMIAADYLPGYKLDGESLVKL